MNQSKRFKGKEKRKDVGREIENDKIIGDPRSGRHTLENRIQRAWRKYKKIPPSNWQQDTSTLSARDHNDRHDNQGNGETTDNNGNSGRNKTGAFNVTEGNYTTTTTEKQRNLNVNNQTTGGNNSDVQLCLWNLDNSVDNMASSTKSKKNVPIFQDLGSSVELDDKDVFDNDSPDIPDIVADKKKNRLSLAEEFAAVSEGLSMMGVSLDCDDTESELDSEFDIGSSSATTPDWDVAPKQNNADKRSCVVAQEQEIINEKRNSLSRGIKPGAMQEDRHRLSISDANDRLSISDANDRLSISDANENYNDPNANSVQSMDSDDSDDVESSTLQQQQNNSDNDTQLTDYECESVNALNNKEEIVRTASYNSDLSHDETHEEPRDLESPHRTADMDSPNEEDKSSTITDESPTEEHTAADCSMPVTETNSNVVVKKTDASAEIAGLEPTMPVLDWESLEKHLAKMEKEEEEQSSKQSQRNSRQAILRKLAMDTDDEAEGDIYGKGKDSLSRRLQSGMNLQICFVNEPVEGAGSDFEDDGQSKEYHGSYPRSYDYDFSSGGVRSRSTGALSRECSNNSTSSGASYRTTPSVTFEDEEDFDTKQSRIHEEARIALARAEPMARMQMELERQQRKKSPVAEMAGVTGLRDIAISLGCKKFQRRALRNMSISKLQFIVNDLHSQIESLNEELVKVLIVRDEINMEQDSKLIDIEDLTRWIRMNMQQNNNNSLIGKQPLENGRKRQYETLMKLLSSTLPVRNKCLCGVSRSSSVVSNRSASSPVSPISPQSYRSQSSASSMSTMAGESHTSSPEMTWVRQAMVKYWYN